MNQWTQEEEDKAGGQVDVMANSTPHKTFTGALVVVATELACQRNTLQDALQNLAYLIAQISPPPYGHKCQWCGDCTKRAKDEARAALEKSA